jgi:cell division protein FtsZ
VDTLITIENDRLLPTVKGKVSLEKAFRLADDTLRQGVEGISDIITIPGLVNVDFADVSAVMRNGGHSFMAIGDGKGHWAALEAAHMALANPLFDAPLEGATGILFNIKGGRDLTLSQVHEVAEIIRKATGSSDANVIFGVVQERKLRKQVCLTVVATGLGSAAGPSRLPHEEREAVTMPDGHPLTPAGKPTTNGRVSVEAADTGRLF